MKYKEGTMRHRVSSTLYSLLWVMVSGLFCTSAQAARIDLNTFYANPTVSVAADGSSATLLEDPDPGIDLVVLGNDPGLGDLEVIIPGPGVMLTFDWSFSEAAGENDDFGFFLIDAATGMSAGAAYEMVVQDTMTGTYSIDLSALSGRTLGAQFQLESLLGDSGTGSMVIVSDLRLTGAAVPAPPPWGLMLIPLAGWMGWKTGWSGVRGQRDADAGPRGPRTAGVQR